MRASRTRTRLRAEGSVVDSRIVDERAVDALPLAARLVQAEQTPERGVSIRSTSARREPPPSARSTAASARAYAADAVSVSSRQSSRIVAARMRARDLHVRIARRVGVALEHLRETAVVADASEEPLERGDDRALRRRTVERLEVRR